MNSEYDMGMIGLGVMGRNLALNMADHRFAIAGYDTDPRQVEALRREGAGRKVYGALSPDDLVARLRRPRAVMVLVPAGSPVDAAISALAARLDPGDLILDGGNSHFTDTNRRAKALERKALSLMGVGVSGGGHGARHGPSLMPGGAREAYGRVRPIFEAIAARAADGSPCVAWLGSGSAGHYVKMVHNGIEYALMRLIAETYDLMHRGLSLSDDELHAVYGEWNRTELSGYLMEITADIFRRIDERTGRHLIDVIRDEAKQKGTGLWASQSAMDLGVPVPTINVAVAMRHLSALESERVVASQVLPGPAPAYQGDRETFIGQLRDALYAGSILTFAQGMALLRAASDTYGYGLNLEDVARIWRAGCIIRAELLEDIRAALHARPDLRNLMLSAQLGADVVARQDDLRAVAVAATELGIPAPAFTASLGYFDAYRSARMPANLTQAQRDYFGAHTYERVDAVGSFHTEWQGR